MELRQLRYFVRVVELGSMGRAAIDLKVVTSALSQQISRLESELSTRLLQRSSTGVVPTDAGLAFWRQAQLALRHVDSAIQGAQQARLSGKVSVGLAPTTSSVLALPFVQAMRERYPDIRLHLVESLSGHLTAMLNARQLDLAVVFQTEATRSFSVMPLLEERLFLMAREDFPGLPHADTPDLKSIARLPLVLPSHTHGLRVLLDHAFTSHRLQPAIIAEIDGLAMLMDMVEGGIAATIQPGAAIARVRNGPLCMRPIDDTSMARRNILVSLSDDELSPAGLAARVTLADVTRTLVRAESWPGATLHGS